MSTAFPRHCPAVRPIMAPFCPMNCPRYWHQIGWFYSLAEVPAAWPGAFRRVCWTPCLLAVSWLPGTTCSQPSPELCELDHRAGRRCFFGLADVLLTIVRQDSVFLYRLYQAARRTPNDHSLPEHLHRFIESLNRLSINNSVIQ